MLPAKNFQIAVNQTLCFYVSSIPCQKKNEKFFEKSAELRLKMNSYKIATQSHFMN